MDLMFTDSAEFPNMVNSPEPLVISKVVQKALIEVNEQSTDAAAAAGKLIYRFFTIKMECYTLT